jgi:hypothetical protein
VALLVLAAVLDATLGCAAVGPAYQPRLVARGELTLGYDGRFEMYAGDRPLTQGLRWDGLEGYVRCVPAAARQAQGASSSGTAAIVLAALGGSLGLVSLGGLAGFAVDDGKHLAAFLGTGVGLAVVGTLLAGLSRQLRNQANGQAVDAMNLYNDSVGSLGATCADLTYPAPAGPIQPAPAAPPPPPPGEVPPAPPAGEALKP